MGCSREFEKAASVVTIIGYRLIKLPSSMSTIMMPTQIMLNRRQAGEKESNPGCLLARFNPCFSSVKQGFMHKVQHRNYR